MLIAVVAGKPEITDSLALVLFGARFVQSLIHLVSLPELAVIMRSTAFTWQMGIAVYGAFRLLSP